MTEPDRSAAIDALAARLQEQERRLVLAEIAERDARSESERLRALLAVERSRIGKLHARICGLEDEEKELNRRIAALLGSTSWRITAPLRVVLRAVKKVVRWAGLHRRPLVHTMRIVPLRGVDRHGDAYVALDEDPQLALESAAGRCPSGWSLIRCSGADCDGYPLAPVLFVGRANARELVQINLPPLAAGESVLVPIPYDTVRLRLDPVSHATSFRLSEIVVEELTRVGLYRELWRRLRAAAPAEDGFGEAVRQFLVRVFPGGAPAVLRELGAAQSYARWVATYDLLTDADRDAIRAHIASLPARPTISVVMPVYDVEPHWLERAVASVRRQLYEHWELCIANDASTRPGIRPLLDGMAASDPRIKVLHRPVNGHISEASNSALSLATGRYVALLDHDDELSETALYHVAVGIAAAPDVGLLYSDEDKVDQNGRRYDPYFKPNWNPDLLRSQNYVSHLGVYRRDHVEAVGGFRKGFEGSQDYDLALRVIERLRPEQIRHIPHVLYHWRAITGSTATQGDAKDYAWQAGRRAVAEHLARQGVEAEVLPADDMTMYYRVRYRLPRRPRVSVVIPTRNRHQLLAMCIDSLRRGTLWPDVELVIVDNGTDEAEALSYIDGLRGEPDIVIVDAPGPFNFSYLVNLGAAAASGELLCLLNNDTEIIQADWLEEMASHALRPEIGAVGALLYYPDGRVQHAGVIVGLGTVAGHIFAGCHPSDPGYFGRAKLTQNLSAVTAACLVVRRCLFEEVGGFDAHELAVAFNDVDFCLKLVAAGYRNLFTPFARLRHHESASRISDLSEERQERFSHEGRVIKGRWPAFVAADPAYNPNLSLLSRTCEPAFPPRVPKPWRRRTESGQAATTEGRQAAAE